MKLSFSTEKTISFSTSQICFLWEELLVSKRNQHPLKPAVVLTARIRFLWIPNGLIGYTWAITGHRISRPLKSQLTTPRRYQESNVTNLTQSPNLTEQKGKIIRDPQK